MKKVLVTGASGFIGSDCLAPLLARGYEVHAVSSRPGGQLEQRDVHWHQADLTAGQSAELLESVRPTHLLHLAWYTAPGAFWTSTENLHWVRASLELLRSFAECGGLRVVFAGSCAEYEWKYDVYSEESTPLVPATLYGACKHGLHTIFEAYARQAGLNAAWGRIFFLYGPNEHPQRLVASVIRSLLRNEPAQCSHGRQIRDLLFSKDVAEAFVALLDSEVTGSVNIGSGTPVALKDVVVRIGEKLGRQELIQLGAQAAPAGEPPVLVADIARLREEVGWHPRYDLDQGLDATIRWWTDHGEMKS